MRQFVGGVLATAGLLLVLLAFAGRPGPVAHRIAVVLLLLALAAALVLAAWSLVRPAPA